MPVSSMPTAVVVSAQTAAAGCSNGNASARTAVAPAAVAQVLLPMGGGTTSGYVGGGWHDARRAGAHPPAGRDPHRRGPGAAPRPVHHPLVRDHVRARLLRRLALRGDPLPHPPRPEAVPDPPHPPLG